MFVSKFVSSAVNKMMMLFPLSSCFSGQMVFFHPGSDIYRFHINSPDGSEKKAGTTASGDGREKFTLITASKSHSLL